MKILLLLFILVSLPCLAQAQQEFAVSCDNVTAIRILTVTAKEPPVRIKNYKGRFYFVKLRLTSEAGEDLHARIAALPWEKISYEGETITVQDIRITAHGRQLKSAIHPSRTASMESISFLYTREREALDAARLVCPSLTPERFSNELPKK